MDEAPSPLDRELELELAELARRGLRRSTAIVSEGVDFTSNDYLGLARDPGLAAVAREAVERAGTGARAARLLAEHLPDHEAAENRVAEWLGAPAALLFPTGYQANLGVIGALVGRGDVIVSDALNHASLIDAARLSRATVRVHAHLDLDQIERELAGARGARRRLVVTEGVFSMDGDRAPLAAMQELCARHDAWLVVDEAHSVGLLGPRGAGAWAEARAAGADDDRVAARVVTGGKALGAAGALVVGSAPLRELLVHRARSFVFSTAPPPALAATLAAAVERAADGEDLRERCRAVARQLADELGAAPPAAAIVPLIIGGAREAMARAEHAAGEGFAVRAVRPPTVPEGTARLRLVAHAHNSVEEARALGRCLDAAVGRDESRRSAPGVPTPTPTPAPPPPPTHPPLIDDVARAGTAIGGGALGTEPRGANARPAPSDHADSQTDSSSLAPAFVVAGTDTDVGKTVISAMALLALSERGPAGYWKPVQTGVVDDTAVSDTAVSDTAVSDASRSALVDDTAEVRRLAGGPGSIFEEPLRRYPLPASPHEAAAEVGDEVPVGELSPQLLELRRRAPRRAWIVELAGGLLVPYTRDRLQADWLQAIRLPLVLVARSGLGTLNHTLLSLEAARARGIEVAALFLVGARHPSNRATLIELGAVEHVFEVEPIEPLDGAGLARWLATGTSHRGARLADVLLGPARTAGSPPSPSTDPTSPTVPHPIT